MRIDSKKHLMVFSGSANPPLAEDVCELLDITLGDQEISSFANGEIYVRFNESVRGADCFVLQSHSAPINRNIMEQLIMVDALSRASARRITVVIPFFGYARQDKKVRAREPITARLMVDLFVSAGADRLVSLDLHTGQVQGFTKKPFDHLTALHLFVDYLRGTTDGPITIVSPDSGRVKLAEKYAKHLEAEVAFAYKRRRTNVRNQTEALWVVGDIKDRHCILVDDMVDTAGTLCSAAGALKEKGAKRVVAYCVHPVLSGPALSNIEASELDEVVVTDTIPLREEALEIPRIRQLSVAQMMAETIRRMSQGESVSSLYVD